MPSGDRHALAGEASGEDVGDLDGCRVVGSEVAQVGDLREPGGEELADLGVVVGHPDQSGVPVVGDSVIETGDACA